VCRSRAIIPTAAGSCPLCLHAWESLCSSHLYPSSRRQPYRVILYNLERSAGSTCCQQPVFSERSIKCSASGVPLRNLEQAAALYSIPNLVIPLPMFLSIGDMNPILIDSRIWFLKVHSSRRCEPQRPRIFFKQGRFYLLYNQTVRIQQAITSKWFKWADNNLSTRSRARHTSRHKTDFLGKPIHIPTFFLWKPELCAFNPARVVLKQEH
jgi:hypothetical protein